MTSIYRLYVGLSRADQQEPVDGDRVVSWLATHLEAFTVVAATGFFQGVKEEALVVTIANSDRQLVVDLVQRLRVHLDQDGIGLEVVGAYQRITAETTGDRS